MYAKKRNIPVILRIFAHKSNPATLLRIMDKLTALWHLLSHHKYLLTLAIFGILIGFIDENNIVRRIGYKREELRLKAEIERYQAEFDESTRRLNELALDSGSIERIAREKYLMKKPQEDIFVFEDDVKKILEQ